MFKLIRNKNFKEIFFNKKELGEILNMYGAWSQKENGKIMQFL